MSTGDKAAEHAELHLRRAAKSGKGAVTTAGEIVVDGVAYVSPSRAGSKVLGGAAYNGWTGWHVGDLKGPTLADLRAQLPERRVGGDA